MKINKEQLEILYARTNRREFVHPDPLEFLYGYPELADREIVGLVASSLAYGRVGQILKSVSKVLERISRPAKFVREATRRTLEASFTGFKHRFTTDAELIALFLGVKACLERFGSLEECFLDGMEGSSEAIDSASRDFCRKLTGGRRNSLLPLPEGTGANKRLNLFLRWMVREDAVDPGGWKRISPKWLMVPLDTHMHRICLAMGMTERKQADIRTVREVTAAFRDLTPEDAVRYDFTLTRMGIRKDQEIRRRLAEWGVMKKSA